MCFNSILVVFDQHQRSKAAFSAGLKLARHWDGCLQVIHAQPDPKSAIPLIGEGMSGTMIEEMIEMADREGNDQTQKAYRLFTDCVKEAGIDLVETPQHRLCASWQVECGRDDEVIAHRGRLTDLTVLSRCNGDGEDPLSSLALNAALFETGRPVLLVGEEPIADFPKHISIAWNGSAECSRAIAYAKPLLRKADQITILSAQTSATDSAVAKDLEEYLALQGLSATCVSFDPSLGAVGESLLQKAVAQGSDLLVMGAYSHSRMRQLILGGVTRQVIENSPIPVFMAH